MSGTVTVTPPQPLVLDLMLTVDDIEAEYVPSSGEFKARTTFIDLADSFRFKAVQLQFWSDRRIQWIKVWTLPSMEERRHTLSLLFVGYSHHKLFIISVETLLLYIFLFYFLTGGGISKRSTCTSLDAVISGCTDSSPSPTEFQFIAAPCYSPTVTSIEPHRWDRERPLAIRIKKRRTSVAFIKLFMWSRWEDMLKLFDTHFFG